MQETPAPQKKMPIILGKGLFNKPTPVPTILVPVVPVPAVTVLAVPVSGKGLDALAWAVLAVIGTSLTYTQSWKASLNA